MKESHLHVVGRTEDGRVRAVKCNANGTAEIGTIRVHPDGKPFAAGERYLFAEKAGEGVMRVTHEVDLRGRTPAVTERYRDGWDRIFGGKDADPRAS